MKNSIRISIVLLIIVVIISVNIFARNVKTKNIPPNILFILTDDLGYGDIGVLYQNQRKEEGKPYFKTPHLDKMASEGMLLKHHYVPAPVCAPSRASLLGGIHQGNAEIRNNQFDKALPDNHNIATVLKEAGYATAIIGKYGLQGKEGNSPETWEAYPTKRGFDHFFGYVRHGDGHNHYPAHEAPERGRKELYAGNEEISDKLTGCYTTDLFTPDGGYDPGTRMSKEVFLEKGYHPIEIVYKKGNTSNTFIDLKWSGTFTMRSLGKEDFFH